MMWSVLVTGLDRGFLPQGLATDIDDVTEIDGEPIAGLLIEAAKRADAETIYFAAPPGRRVSCGPVEEVVRDRFMGKRPGFVVVRQTALDALEAAVANAQAEVATLRAAGQGVVDSKRP
jgi:hypothetical protein